MSGLNYDGLPSNLKNTSFPFPYNDFDYLNKLIVRKNRNNKNGSYEKYPTKKQIFRKS